MRVVCVSVCVGCVCVCASASDSHSKRYRYDSNSDPTDRFVVIRSTSFDVPSFDELVFFSSCSLPLHISSRAMRSIIVASHHINSSKARAARYIKNCNFCVFFSAYIPIDKITVWFRFRLFYFPPHHEYFVTINTHRRSQARATEREKKCDKNVACVLLTIRGSRS